MITCVLSLELAFGPRDLSDGKPTFEVFNLFLDNELAQFTKNYLFTLFCMKNVKDPN